MIKAFTDWLDDRTGYKLLVHEALNEPIPGGARWWYVWGSTLTFVFFIQVITGFFLWSAYSPSTLTAWESVYYIENVMNYGWLVRGIHHFSAQAMMILLAMHFIQVVWDGAYKAPREVNFWLGLILMQIVLGLALTGYLLPWDQKGYYATKVATKIASVTPFIGPQIQELVQGGPSYGHQTLTRFFALHAGVLPALLVAFLGLHVYVFRRHGITTPDPKAAPATFWPDQVLKDAVACLVVLAVILFFVVWKGAELSAPADPAEEYPARPEWYFLFLFRFLKFEEVARYGEAFGAIYIPGLAMAIIALMPFIARIKGGHWFNVLFIVALIGGAGTLTVLAMNEDKNDVEFQGKLKFAERDAHRVVELAEREGIPPLGARELMTDDAYTQGPRLFARHCSGCHRYQGHDGMEVPKLKEVLVDGKKQKVEEPATATDLGTFGKREWLDKVLVDFHGVFAPLESDLAVASYGEKGKRFLNGDMANWSKDNKAVLEEAANADSRKALVEFVVAQSGRTDLGTFDETLVKQGRDIFTAGKLASGALSSNCSDCHSLIPVGETTDIGTAGAGGPKLTGYGGKEWLTAFLKNPGHDDFYGANNVMPAFESIMTPKELELLVNWMVGDYYRGPHHHE